MNASRENSNAPSRSILAKRFLKQALRANATVTSSILAEREGFQVFETIDKGIEFEQNLTGRKLAIVILVCKSNRLQDFLPLAPACAIATSCALPGRITRASY